MVRRDDPFEQMNRFFEQTRRSFGADAMPVEPTARRGEPWGRETNFHVEETDDGYVVMADLPGFEKEDITIRFDDGVLAVAGETVVAEEAPGMARRHSRSVSERLTFPETVVADEITASYHNGVLEITLPTEGDDFEDEEHRIDID